MYDSVLSYSWEYDLIVDIFKAGFHCAGKLAMFSP